MESKHTPGPWRVAGTLWVEQENGRLVARAVTLDRSNLEKQEEEQRVVQANARLIAAAPELLEALAFCVEALEVEAPIYRDHIAQARAAIAKAKGE